MFKIQCTAVKITALVCHVMCVFGRVTAELAMSVIH